MSEKQKPVIPMTACKSSAVTAHGYHADSNTLALTFKGGKTYRYPGFPAELYGKLQGADSVGKFVAANITGKFKVEGP